MSAFMNKDQVMEILKTQYDERFWNGMKARMEMSFFKYGDVKDAAGRTDFLASLQQRLDKYKEIGNTEFLMDAANFAMLEFMFPSHKSAHFKATDSDESPGRTSIHGTVSARPNLEKYTYRKDGD